MSEYTTAIRSQHREICGRDLRPYRIAPNGIVYRCSKCKTIIYANQDITQQNS